MARVLKPGAAIRAMLMSPGATDSAAALSAQIGSGASARVFIGKYPPVERFNGASEKGIVMARVAGGSLELGTGIARPRYVVHCLGGSDDPDKADDVYGALQWFMNEGGYNVETAYGRVISNEEVFGLAGWDDIATEKDMTMVKCYFDFEVAPVGI